MRAAVYERVSTDAQVDRCGLGAQYWGLKKCVQDKALITVPDGLKDAFVDDGYSGADLNRPALSRLREALRDRKVDVVLCYDPDRLSRGSLHVLAG